MSMDESSQTIVVTLEGSKLAAALAFAEAEGLSLTDWIHEAITDQILLLVAEKAASRVSTS